LNIFLLLSNMRQKPVVGVAILALLFASFVVVEADSIAEIIARGRRDFEARFKKRDGSYFQLLHLQ